MSSYTTAQWPNEEGSDPGSIDCASGRYFYHTNPEKMHVAVAVSAFIRVSIVENSIELHFK